MSSFRQSLPWAALLLPMPIITACDRAPERAPEARPTVAPTKQVAVDEAVPATPVDQPRLPATHCLANERTVFSCTLKKAKVISICTTNTSDGSPGRVDYRFGRIGKIEMRLSSAEPDIDNVRLTRSTSASAEYNSIEFFKSHFRYSVTSFRQLKPQNEDGSPVPPTSDTLGVEDMDKSMKEGNWVFSEDCTAAVPALNVPAIAEQTGLKVEKAGF